jgi:four helix bundle protein
VRFSLRQELFGEVLQLVEAVRAIVVGVDRRDRDLASQLRRAVNSVGLNIAEGFGTAAGNSRLRFQTARGSLYETQVALRLAVAWGFTTEEQIAPALKLLDHLGARLFGLSNR